MSRRSWWWIAGATLAVLVAVTLLVVAHPWRTNPVPWAKPAGYTRSEVAFVDDQSCARCHETQYREWSGSHHHLAMQPASDETVRGDFRDATFTRFGVTSRFVRRGGRFFVNTEGPDGKLADFEIKYTFGVDPLQQYLIEFPGGRLQSLTIAWDTVHKRWFSLYPDEKIAHGDSLHWTGRYQNWNMMCAECHTTNLKRGYDARTDSYQTTWAALDVGCQACHGPGQAHVAWADARGASQRVKSDDDGLLVKVTRATSREQVDQCAPCHSRRAPLDIAAQAGHPFLDEFKVEGLRPELYHPDGQQLGEVYEYGSFRQSKMYQQGVRCTDCHNPHTAKVRADGNALCTRCHGAPGDPRFPGAAAKVYDAVTHHFHRPGSAGAQCVNCHMPTRNYMVVHARRDHSIRIPRPDLSVKLGTPNACTACHKDRSPQWAAAQVEKWYGHTPGPHYGETIAAGLAGAPDAVPKLAALAEDQRQPAIVRAAALDTLRRYGPASSAAIVAATKDEDPVVRASAAAGLARLPEGERLAAATPLLKDPVRSVRIEAARALASTPADRFDSAQRQAYEAALAEVERAHSATADMPGSHLNAGVMYEAQGRRDQAEQSYLTALRLDPYFGPARANLARLYDAEGKNADAERVLREGIKLTPSEGELHYSLGLLLAGANRLPEAVQALGEAARLLPDRARVRYNYGLALQKLGRLREAEMALLEAERLNPRDPQIEYALAFFYAAGKQYQRALVHAERSALLVPDDANSRELVERIKRQMASSTGGSN
ncbi:MAG TPA: tetratricopeptide repeat protein [Candidatus Methylomirabilis sp.]|nr:tetratricopeptide repeat protein [Candidatus Methylomirabilis sp.]